MADFTPTASASNGERDTWASPSGLVARINSRGLWYAFIPVSGITYKAQYYNIDVAIQNKGDGTYNLILNGVSSTRRYDNKWSASKYWDADHDPIATPELASAEGEPDDTFMTPGPVLANVATANPATGVDEWTRSSDGKTDVWPSPSGMVGKRNAADAWYMYMPSVGVQYRARYWGMDIELSNAGNGVYNLVLNGVASQRRYSSEWERGQKYDSAGDPITIPLANIPNIGNPDDDYFRPGPVVVGTETELTVEEPDPGEPTPTVTVRPRVSRPRTATDPRTTPASGGSGTTPAGGGGGTTPAGGGGGTTPAGGGGTAPPQIVAFPTGPGPGPSPAPDSGGGKLALIAAAAAFFLMR